MRTSTHLLTQYVPTVRIMAVHLTHKDIWCATSREQASKQKTKEMTKATLALRLLLSSKLILSTKAGAADTEETAWSALGLDCLCVHSFFLPHPPSLRNMFHGLIVFPLGFLKFICFEKTDVAAMDWSCYSPFVNAALLSAYTNQKWPNYISVVSTRCYTSRRVYCIAFCHVLSLDKDNRGVLLTWLFHVWD